MAENRQYIFPKEDGVALVDGVPRIVDHEAWEKRQEEHRRDRQYFGAHREELLEKYPDQWVAVFREEVIFGGPDRRAVSQMVVESGIHINHAVIRFIDTDPPTLIL